jgi:hypothetical protein
MIMTTIDTTPDATAIATISRDGALGGDETEVVTTDQATGLELTRYAVDGPATSSRYPGPPGKLLDRGRTSGSPAVPAG